MMLNRRGFFQFGGVSALSTGLLQMLAAQTAPRPATTRPRAKACILLYQVGGPYQAETFDPKPDAIAEVRGIFQTISTRVPGIRMTDALPRVAEHADKFAILRGVHHTIRCHNPAIYCSLVGREATDPMAISNRTAARRTDHPHYASVVARLRPPQTSMPFHVIIPNTTNNGPSKSPGLLGGYLGAAYDPFVLGADPSDPDFRVESVVFPEEVSARRFESRQTLLQRLDQQQRTVERGGAVESMNTLYQRAFDMLTAPASKEAFDLSREPERVRDRYGRHLQGQSTLLARRLVEAGVPFVSVFSHVDVDRGSWDTHQNHNARVREQLLPPADQSFSALLEDLQVRGMLDETLVIWMGEFGRTPRMGVNFSNNTNNVGGRDHWCNCYSVVLAGGGVQGGRAIGSSDSSAAYPRTSRPRQRTRRHNFPHPGHRPACPTLRHPGPIPHHLRGQPGDGGVLTRKKSRFVLRAHCKKGYDQFGFSSITNNRYCRGDRRTMRFFTKEWLSGELTDAAFDAMPTEYRLYIAALRLPHDVLALSEVDIHDGWMLDVQCAPQAAQLMLRLRCGDLQRGYCDLNINYSAATLDVASLAVLHEDMRLPKDELLYDEVDRIDDRFEHRFILSSHKEVCVRFAAVAVGSHPVCV